MVYVLKPLRTSRFAKFNAIYLQASQNLNTPSKVVFLLAENKPSELVIFSPQQIGKINGNTLFEL